MLLFCMVGGVFFWRVAFYNVDTMLKSVKRGGLVKRPGIYTLKDLLV